MMACEMGHFVFVKWMLDHGASVDKKDVSPSAWAFRSAVQTVRECARSQLHGDTSLHYAAATSNLKIVELLLEAGAHASGPNLVRGT